MAEITDLDDFVGPDIIVRLSGVEYPLPADCPAELFLLIRRLGQQAEDMSEGELISLLYDQLLDLFQVRNPGLEKLPIGVRTIVNFIPLVYGGEGKTEEIDPPTTPKTRGATGKTPAKPAAATRSR